MTTAGGASDTANLLKAAANASNSMPNNSGKPRGGIREELYDRRKEHRKTYAKEQKIEMAEQKSLRRIEEKKTYPL